jgi:hypothetical protein
MGKGVYANSGLCLTCRRYSPKSLGNCKIVKDALEHCSEYLERVVQKVAVATKKKRNQKKKEPTPSYSTDERTTITALLEKKDE